MYILHTLWRPLEPAVWQLPKSLEYPARNSIKQYLNVLFKVTVFMMTVQETWQSKTRLGTTGFHRMEKERASGYDREDFFFFFFGVEEIEFTFEECVGQ